VSAPPAGAERARATRRPEQPLHTIWTVGHSTRSIEEFVALLEENAIRALADIRRYAGSRRHPQFAREALESSLRAAGIDYRWLPELGGRRAPRKDSRNTAWRNDSFRGYADYMETEAFHLGISRLLELARVQPTACMCAEQAWQQCHRGLVSDYLKAQGWEVMHLLGRSRTQPHPYTEPARIVEGQLNYAAEEPTQRELRL
jgi:uncharacterized protein (DUF488 family)